jgi:hypothetical protein
MTIQLSEVKPLAGYRLWLKYADGVEGVVDLSDLVGQGVFALWNDAREFQNARATRSAVIRNDDVDLDATALYLQLTGKQPEDIFPRLRKLQCAWVG